MDGIPQAFVRKYKNTYMHTKFIITIVRYFIKNTCIHTPFDNLINFKFFIAFIKIIFVYKNSENKNFTTYLIEFKSQIPFLNLMSPLATYMHELD